MQARKIPDYVIAEARELYTRLVKTEPDINLSLLEKVQNGETLPPDDWALVQETFAKTHPLAKFFNTYRKEISRQLSINGRNYTSVAMITFTHNNEPYVLLMENIGLAASVKEREIQWTAHGTRVDEMERELLSDARLWQQYIKISGGDDAVAALLAAAVRRIRSMGIILTEQDILKTHLIDRAGAGFPEEDPVYRTEYFNIDLGEREPNELMRACTSAASTRFGQWTRCFKLADLNANIKVLASDKSGRNENSYEFTYNNATHAVRSTTWCFLKALKLVREFALQPEGITRDPWQLRNIGSYERASQWVRNKLDDQVQITIFSEKHNRLSSAKIHAYAAKAKLDPENLAYACLHPERLVLHAIIAHLTALICIKNGEDLEAKADTVYRQFFQVNPAISAEWEHIYKQMEINLDLLWDDRAHNADSNTELSRIRELVNTLDTTRLDDRQETIYHLHESNIQIAKIICLHEMYQAFVLPRINELVRALIYNNNFEFLEHYPLADRQCFGVTGPVASGKSVSENLARSILRTKNAAFISSDEWNHILSACLDLEHSGFTMQRGKLTLAEAWFIKVNIWKLMKEMELTGHAPNWIQEACDPTSLELPRPGSMLVFINTANPRAAAGRVKDRGDKSGRYVSASAATGSYRWPWLNFLSALDKIKGNASMTVQIMDTDVMFAAGNMTNAERLKRTNIAAYNNGKLEIHNLQRFINFIERSFKVHASPRNPGEIWVNNQSEAAAKLKLELQKLFNPKLGLSISYNGKILTEEYLTDFADKWNALVVGLKEGIYRQRSGLFAVKKEMAPTPVRVGQSVKPYSAL